MGNPFNLLFESDFSGIESHGIDWLLSAGEVLGPIVLCIWIAFAESSPFNRYFKENEIFQFHFAFVVGPLAWYAADWALD